MDIYLEIGKKRTFAGAVDWPGYCRRGTDEATALQALIEAGPRYARALRGTRLGFEAPRDVTALRVAERLPGDATTDFGAPGASPATDEEPLGPDDLRRSGTILRATWRAFDRAVDAAKGRTLRTGPRGGGRSLDKIVQHVLDAEGGYLSALGWKHRSTERDRTARLAAIREAILEGLAASARGEIPRRGPRGGLRWSARYFVRREAWHALDHAWEIEDRAL
jgi:hypothetical protein